ncbi:YegJ family protein [Ideonella sp.]|uniref:YegJ family protein n=1 Tax=Ideonella sp. TaxID=1929293 RepID=UPI0035AE9191
MPLSRWLTIAALVAAPPTLGQTILDQAANDEIVLMRSEEPAMQKAFARAAATLPDFLERAARPREGTSGYALKVAVSDKANTEYFWVSSFTQEGDTFSGVLSNEPRLVNKHRMGDRIAFRRAHIVDWTYFDVSNQQTVGNFTACALLSREPPEQAAAFKRQYGLSCED